MKVLLVGVGNSGTKLLGQLIHRLLIDHHGMLPYHYEPLYWSGTMGDKNLVLNRRGILEHVSFPLLPDESCVGWPWMDGFIRGLDGLAKFIRAASRIRLFLLQEVSVVWITRELQSFLASMQRNFPRCLGTGGWHHRPGEYDDLSRLRLLFQHVDLPEKEEQRVIAEAAWWQLHNAQPWQLISGTGICHVRYEDLCSRPADTMARVADFLDLSLSPGVLAECNDVRPAAMRRPILEPAQLRVIQELAGELNASIYPES